DLLDPAPRCPVQVAVNLCALHEIAPGSHGLESGDVDEMIFAPVLLSLPGGARRMRDRKLQPAIGSKHGIDQSRLPGARGSGHHDEVAAHSMFCTCSRICSMRTF